MTNLANSKALIITGLDQNLHPLFPVITNKNMDELLITTSFGNAIAHPYGCTIRNIIMSVYYDKVNEIYFIAEKESVEFLMNEDDFLTKLQEHGISKTTIETIEYIDVVGGNLKNWLIGERDIKNVIKENINLIKKHPLIPSNIQVHGILANKVTGEYETV